MTPLEIHNKSYRRAARAIINPTLKADGGPSDVMVVLESTIAAVLLSLYEHRAASMLHGLLSEVLERIEANDNFQKNPDN